MRLGRIIISVSLAVSLAAPYAPCAYAADDTGKNLAKFVKDPSPWTHVTANSEQRRPVYLGSTPREMVFRTRPSDEGRASLYESMRRIGEAEALEVRDALVRSGAISKEDPVEFEVWPVEDARGQLTWAFARWRRGRGSPWQRLNAHIMQDDISRSLTGRRPVLPVTLDPAKPSDFSRIFDDTLASGGLYEKPAFGDCVWMTGDGIVLDAWLPVEQREAFGREVSEDLKKMSSSLMCRILPQPPRLAGRPITFIIRSEEGRVAWPENIYWKKEDAPRAASPVGAAVKEWPKGFEDGYKNDVLIFSGEKEAVFPGGRKRSRLSDRNNASAENDLQDAAAYLTGRYNELGIKTWRQDFAWRGSRHSNVIAVIPGKDPSLPPVVLAAHMDAPFCDDIFIKERKRVSSPGADNNASGTAALLSAADTLRGMGLARTIWLAHLTGSEFPADSLGARHFISTLFSDRKDLEGVILVDSIGRSRGAARALFIDTGDGTGSADIGSAASAAARSMGLEPVVRTRFNSRSLLYDGDGLVFSDHGFPVATLTGREHKDGSGSVKPPNDSSDTHKGIDWAYAVSAAKAVIEAAASMASKSSPVPQKPGSAQAGPASWSVIVYAGIDESDMAKAYNPRLKELLDAPVPDNVELILERDADWPDGSARIIRTSSSHEEFDLPERDSASPETLKSFLQWAGGRSSGGRKLLIIQGSSWGWRGMIRDSTVPGRRGSSSLLALRDLASAVRESGLRPDVVLMDASILGSAEVIEELKDVAPYIIVSQLDIPYNGFPASKLFEMVLESEPFAGRPGLTTKEFARRIPEAYVKEYAREGSMSEAENKYFTVTMTAVDTGKWDAFRAKFRELADALRSAGYAQKIAARPGWSDAIIDGNNNADIVELLNRLPPIAEDPAVIKTAADMLEMIGYPGDVAAESASAITIDPSNVRSFELRIETCPYLQKERALDEIKAAWRSLNQDLELPDTLGYGISESWDDKGPKREFIVRCPEGAISGPITFRPWLAGAKYCVLTAIGRDGKAAERRFIKGNDYFSVKEFPEGSFMLSEAHNQGAPFVHGIGVAMDPGFPAGRPPLPVAPVPYSETAWNKATGWADLISGSGPGEKQKNVE